MCQCADLAACARIQDETAAYYAPAPYRLFLRRGGLDRAHAEERPHAGLRDGELIGKPRGDTPLLSFLDTFRTELVPHFDAVEPGVSGFQHEAAAAFRPIWRVLRAVAIHAALVAAVLMTVPAVMDSERATFGAGLPWLTRVMRVPGYHSPLLLLLLPRVAGLFWLQRRMRRIFSLSESDGGWLASHATRSFGRVDFWSALAIVRAACRSGYGRQGRCQRGSVDMRRHPRICRQWVRTGPRSMTASCRRRTAPDASQRRRVATCQIHAIWADIRVSPHRVQTAHRLSRTW